MNTNIVTLPLAMADALHNVSARTMTVLMAATLAGGLLATDAQARGGGGHGGGGHVGGFGGGAGARGGGFGGMHMGGGIGAARIGSHFGGTRMGSGFGPGFHGDHRRGGYWPGYTYGYLGLLALRLAVWLATAEPLLLTRRQCFC